MLCALPLHAAALHGWIAAQLFRAQSLQFLVVWTYKLSIRHDSEHVCRLGSGVIETACQWRVLFMKAVVCACACRQQSGRQGAALPR
jgi:hypothetical protein